MVKLYKLNNHFTIISLRVKFQYSWTDLSPILTPAFQDLTRMLYLEDWDDFAPASCPTLTKMKCFICNQTGHTRLHCKASVPVIEEGTSTQSSFKD
ncbi:hypothetical protein BD770DRAFT_397065, partial [Pilaira anomala]